MAAPAANSYPAGATDATGDWSFSFPSSASYSFILFFVFQDGATGGAVTQTGSSNVNTLAGSAGLTYVGTRVVGSPTNGYLHLYCGRKITPAVNVGISGTNSTSEDIYCCIIEFGNVNTGTTLAAVMENGTAGSWANIVGLSATAEAPDITTLGPDRLGILITSVNDDNAVAAYTSPGTWTVIQHYAESSGTDGCIDVQVRTISSATTVSPGTSSITDSDSWGVISFALIGTTVADQRVPRSTPYPQLLAH